jgi:N-acyl homoserine lactone hydrolase
MKAAMLSTRGCTDRQCDVYGSEAATVGYEHPREPLQSNVGERSSTLAFTLRQVVSLASLLFLIAGNSSTAQPGASPSSSPVSIRLYTLDCGLTEFEKADAFSDTGEYAGKSIALPTPCLLIHHGKDWLLWDTGNGDRLAALPNGISVYGGRFTQKHTLAGQLAELGLKPDDINFVALSHLHQDHTGNIGLFPKATFLVSAVELAWARGKPTPFGVDTTAIEPLDRAHVDALDEDRDVFNDGSVQMLKAPGHTPGSRMLLVQLAHSGTVFITGDLYHTRENYQKALVPSPNISLADTLASSQRYKAIVANTNARVVIQHAPEDFASMPTFPKYLD